MMPILNCELTARAVGAMSEAVQTYISECGCDTQSYIAYALDQNSEALAVVAPRLPKPLRNLPKVVAETSIRSAPAGPRRRLLARSQMQSRSFARTSRWSSPRTWRQRRAGGEPGNTWPMHIGTCKRRARGLALGGLDASVSDL